MIPTIRQFTKADVASALRLCRSAGWNQLRCDWDRLVDYQPDGCFVAEFDDQLVGTITTTSYGSQLAWIGMMLVHPEYRRRGIATKLMNAGLEFLRGGGVRCIKLDATPAGQPVYEKLGFHCEWSFHRWQLESPPSCEPFADSGESQLAQPPMDQYTALDLEAFGVDRTDWLHRQRVTSAAVHHANGFGMLRVGYLANYLGPVTAADPDSASQIIGELLSRVTGTTFWDIPQPNHHAVELARRLGFTPVRDLMRMWVGDLLSPKIDLQYAMCDPGTG